jgi:hypothetical protein
MGCQTHLYEGRQQLVKPKPGLALCLRSDKYMHKSQKAKHLEKSPSNLLRVMLPIAESSARQLPMTSGPDSMVLITISA